MKALTVCQPYASLIVGWPGIDPDDVKRVENRSRNFGHQGPLLIHAGKSTDWLGTWEGSIPENLPMGKIRRTADTPGLGQINP